MSNNVQNAIVAAVTRGVAAAAKLPSTDTTTTDAPQVASKVLTELAPVVMNATNNEPWYQSRVTWGAIASIALPLLGVVGVTSDVIDPDTFVTLGLALGSAVGGLLTLYGRWKAKKPIGA